MLDGAKIHTALSTREFLKGIIENQLIGKHMEKSYPLYSSDLTPTDWNLGPLQRPQLYTRSQS